MFHGTKVTGLGFWLSGFMFLG